MRHFYLLIAICFLSPVMWAVTNDPLSNLKPQREAIAHYLQSADMHSTVFTGREHEKYPLHYKNHPWFQSDNYSKATIYINGMIYPDIQLKWDLYKDQLVISPENSPYNIVTNADSAFLFNQKVCKLPFQNNQLPFGYVIVLHEGHNTLYLKHLVHFRERVESGQLVSSFAIRKTFWLAQAEGMTKITRLRDVTRLYPQHRREIRSFLKNNSLNYRKNPELALTSLMEYLEQL